MLFVVESVAILGSELPGLSKLQDVYFSPLDIDSLVRLALFEEEEERFYKVRFSVKLAGRSEELIVKADVHHDIPFAIRPLAISYAEIEYMDETDDEIVF